MSNLIELKRISIDFRNLSSDLLNSDKNNVDSNLYRFKEYIDKTDIICNIIKEKTDGVEVIFSECFPLKSSNWCEVKIPLDESQQIKAISDLIEYIVNNKISVLSIAFHYICSSNKFTDIIQNYLDITIKPLINYIRRELSKEMIIEEEKVMPGININNPNNSNINIAKDSTQNITNNININNDIFKAIETLKEELEKSQITQEEKENIADDLDVIKEQLENSIEKPTRLKKAYTNLLKYMDGSTNLVLKATAVVSGIQKLIELIGPYINK